MTQLHPLGYYLVYWLISGLAVAVTAFLIPGFKISGFWAALFASMAIALVTTVAWPFLMFLTLPINILTLGLFTFVVNGMVIKIAAAIMPGFEVTSWWSAIFGAIIYSLASSIFHYFLFLPV